MNTEARHPANTVNNLFVQGQCVDEAVDHFTDLAYG